MVLEMISRGVDPEVIARAVQAAEETLFASISSRDERDKRVTNRRETDRLRQQRYRDSHDSLRDNRDNRDVPLSKSNLKEEEREAESVTSRDEKWSPTEPAWRDAVTQLGESGAASELAKFREINRRPPGAKRDADWRVWVIRAVDYAAKNKPAVAPALPAMKDAEFNWAAVVKTYRRTGYWSPQAGPDPESPACKCPRELLEQTGPP